MTESAGTARPSIPLSIWLLTAACVAVGILGLAAAWTGAALVTRSQCGWMALVAALDAAVMLRLAGFPSGRLRAGIAVLMTVVAIALANYFLVATRLGMRMGLEPAESTRQLSIEMAWILARYAQDTWDLVFIVVAVLLAWWWGR